MRTPDDSWWTQVLAGPGGDLTAADSDERYVVLPSTKAPRVVVDRSSPLAVRDAVERFASARTQSRLVRSAVGAGAQLLAKSKGSWAVRAPRGSETLCEHLSAILGESVRLSVAVGPPRPNRKPVVRCYGEAGLVAVAKLGPSPHTAEMVGNEARWLGVMASQPLTGVTVPTVLHSGSFGGSALLVMSALDLVSDLGMAFEDVPLPVVRELSDRYLGEETLMDTPWWRDLGRRVGKPGSSAARATIAESQQDPLFNEIRVSAWHGDWSPWNMGRSTAGDLCIWDWERSMIGVPVGFDVLHLHFHYGSGLDSADADLRIVGVPDAHHQLLKRLYLVEILARHADAAALSGQRYDAVLSALHDLGGSRVRR